MEHLNEAFSLLLVGMITVFIILSLVVAIGNIVIRLTNRYLPVETIAAKDTGGRAALLNSAQIAAVIAAVEAVTGGKGNVEKIEKIEK